MLPNARDIARSVSIQSVLQNFGWRVRSRNRADCGLCRGNSKGTVAFTDRLWKCHRCNEGGDVFSLVRAAHGCGFPDALKFVADLAGISLEVFRTADLKRELAVHQEKRQRVDAAANELEILERALRIQCRDRIHTCDRVLNAPGPWTEAHWRRAQAASVLRDDYLLPEYTLLSVAAVLERARYVLADWNARAAIVSAWRIAGGVHTEDGKWVEVLR